MTLKKLLKPDWRKILIFVVTLLILPFPQPILICQYPGPCRWELSSLYGNEIISTISMSINDIYTGGHHSQQVFNFIFFTIVGLIISYLYLLSCLIVRIYDKFKRFKSKK
jgi:hypothetical protein